jgi:RNA polymerase sigma-70 factor (ECF subfamily)
MPNHSLLFELFKKGDENAFIKLFHLHYSRLFLLAFVLWPDDLRSEDIVNESFLKAWKKRRSFRTLKDLLTFLEGVIEEAYTPPWHSTEAIEEDPFHQYGDHDILNQNRCNTECPNILLERALGYIGPISLINRRILELFYLDGKSTSQIAVKLGMTRGAVRALKRRALLTF